MKKIFAILVLIVFFYNQVAYYLAYSIISYGEKERIERHILSILPESECEIINLTANAEQIHWEEEGEVFILNGIMYDIAKKKITSNNIYAYCITEKKEMEMVADRSLKFTSAGNSGTDFDMAFSAEYTLQNNKAVSSTLLLHALHIPLIYSTPLTHLWADIILPPPRITVS